MQDFRPILKNLITSANKTATRFLKEIKTFTHYREQKLFYFLMMDSFSVLYDKTSNMDYNAISDRLSENASQIENNKIVLDTFWSIITTSDENGEECEPQIFLNNMRALHGKKNHLISVLEFKIQNIFTDFQDIKEQTYRFEFQYYENHIITLKGRLPENAVNEILATIKHSYFKDISEYFESYFKSHRIEYSEFKYVKEETKNINELRKEIGNGGFDMEDFRKLTDDYDNYYRIINMADFIDEDMDFRIGFVVILKKTTKDYVKSYKSIYQEYRENCDCYEDEDCEWGFITIYSNSEEELWHLKELDNLQEIVLEPNKNVSLTIDLLMNIDNINSVENLKNFITDNHY